jgi:hypothetical protein
VILASQTVGESDIIWAEAIGSTKFEAYKVYPSTWSPPLANTWIE